MDTVDRDVRARLSWMWVFVMLNMIFADIFSFMIAGNLKQIMEGHADQITITPEFLLLQAMPTLAMALGLIALDITFINKLRETRKPAADR